MYVVTQGRKLYGMPTDFGFCIKVRILPGASELLLGPPQTSLLAPCPAPWRKETTSGSKGRCGTRQFPLPAAKFRNGHKGLHLFCTEDEQSSCWLGRLPPLQGEVLALAGVLTRLSDPLA